MKLVIVESPTKVKSVGHILGKGYVVKASKGHIRDLPEKDFGVDVEHDFQPEYVVTPRQFKNLADLKEATRNVDTVYLASDPDREGEAIAWHLREELSKVNAKANFCRVTYNQITKAAVEDAFKHPRDIDMALVNAQQARRVIDRIVGYCVSPLLWRKIARGISAGRVQSVAQRLICEREREILAFQPEEYWNFIADFQALNTTLKPEDSTFRAKLSALDGKSLDKWNVDNQKLADRILADVQGVSNWHIVKVDKSPRKRNPFPPFITSSLQQAATALGFTASRTLKIAQDLYEGIDLGHGTVGLITYMRTDSVAVAPEAQQSVRALISSTLGKQYLPLRPPVYKSKGTAQEAHEAIRPTDVNYIPSKIKDSLTPEQFKIYDLIWRRFVASQMAPADTMQTKVDVAGSSVPSKISKGHGYNFHATATVTTFQGFLRVYQYKDPDADEESEHNAQILGNLVDQQPCELLKALSEQKFTEPKPRYTEASLIKELESNGIGRPSTYASIIETIIDREYTKREKGKLVPTDLGFKVNDYLVAKMPDLFQVGFTAEMENSLDDIDNGAIQWVAVMKDFYEKFKEWFDIAKESDDPSLEKVRALISEMTKIVNWEQPEPSEQKKGRGKKAHGDQSFFQSLQGDVQKKGGISSRQWDSLLDLAVEYESEMPKLNAVARKFGFADELATAKEKHAEKVRKKAEREAIDAERAKTAPKKEVLTEVFDALKDIAWKEPTKRRGRTYNDADFVGSLKKQFEAGKPFSEKQTAALANLIAHYKDQIANFERIQEILAIPENRKDGDAASGTTKVAGDSDEAKSLLDAMKTVKVWNAPTRGKSDEEFVDSLKKQFKTRKSLSVKQIAALRKLTAKYGVVVATPKN